MTRAGAGARTLVVAGLAVRALAESACRAGWDVVALDLFGDADTRRASVRWAPLGEPGSLRIDPTRLRAELRNAAGGSRVDGWVPGSGFEDAPALLAAGDPALPCLAVAPRDLARLRDPATFFGVLARHALAHPRVSIERPAEPAGWLAKRAGGCGGLHIRTAGQALADPQGLPPDVYFQRWQAGTPGSASFVADGAGFRVIALNRLLVRPVGLSPHAYAGALGPVHDVAVAQAVDRALAVLVPEFGLRGLGSLDFVAHGSSVHFLEVNPRPSATLQLHDDAWPGGLVRAHVEAVHGRLPATPARHDASTRGHLTVFADRPGHVDDTMARELLACPHVHDVPLRGTRVAGGEPVCTVSATAAEPQEVLRLLDERAAAVRRRLAATRERVA